MDTVRIFCFLVASFHILSTHTLGSKIRIGGLFDTDQEDVRLAFGYAVNIANTEILDPANGFQLEALQVEVPFGNEFLVSKKLCRLLKSGVAAIIGPQSPVSAVHVQSICDAKEMPHIETRWEPVATAGMPSLNIHPHAQTLSRVFVDLVRAFDWKSFTIVYENAPYLVALADLLKLYDPKGHTVTVRQLDLGLQDNYRAVLRRVKLSEEKNIVLHCSVDILPEVLKQAQQVGIMSENHQYIITSMDLHTIDLEPYQYSDTNITGIRLIDPEDQRLLQVTDFWKNLHEEENLELPDSMMPANIKTEVALTFDSVLLFADAFNQLHGTKQLKPVSLNCDDGDTWINGYSIVNYMKTSNTRGLTRNIKFDHKGHRTDFLLDIVELGAAGLEKVAVWNSSEGLQPARATPAGDGGMEDGLLKNKTFIVITALSPPYGMLRLTPNTLTGNERFEGFGIDLIHELSLMLGFNYTFTLQEDGVYGTMDENGNWNGMMKELMDYRADLAITDLTITAERESAVDFTMPFMNLGISILYKKPTKLAPSLFSFMSPFSAEVWIYLGFGYMGVSICLFILGRISPGEWDNPYPCIEEPEFLETQFTFRNAMWFCIGALLQQGTELAPKTPSTRAIVSIWWFFTLIMVSSYTANLAAFLTVESLSPTIGSAEDLAGANGAIKYGAKRGGSTFNFFKDAEYETYQKMYEYMNDNPDMLTSSNPEGLSRVKNENYAFLMESTSIEYITERDCDVTMVNGLLDDKGYGIAMRKNSPYRNTLSAAVLQLQESGKLALFKIKWWKEKHGGGACATVGGDSAAVALGIANVGGVFLLLFIGLTAAVVISLLEFLFDIKARAKELKVSFREEFIEEMKFVGKCHGNTKIVRHRKSSSSNSKLSASTDHIERGSTRSRSTDGKNSSRNIANVPDMIVTAANGHPWFMVKIMNGLLSVFLLNYLLIFALAYEPTVKLGAIFEGPADDAELAFTYAVETANNEILAPTNSRQLEAVPIRVFDSNEFMVSKKVCRTLRTGIAGIIGPQSPHSSVHVHSICDAKEMPHIQARWDPIASTPFALNIHPDPHTLARVFVDMVRAWEWKEFTILYENAAHLPRLSDLLKMYDPKGYTITVRQLDLGLQNNNYRSVLRRVKLARDIHIVLDCSVEVLPEVLKQAQQVGLMTDYHQFIITNLDLHTLDLEPYQYSGTNITGIRLYDPEDLRVQQITQYWQHQHRIQGQEMSGGLQAHNLSTETVLVFDSVIIYAEALKQLKGSRQLRPTQLNCDDNLTWSSGSSIMNFIKTSHARGLSRDIHFDNKGLRSDFLLDVVELGPAGLHKIGMWNSTEGLNLTRHYQILTADSDENPLRNKTFIVLTALSPPYGMLTESAHKLSGNARFEGFGIDLIHELSLMLGFNYTFTLQEDGVYGTSDENGEWNGMIKELLEFRADLAITDLTINSDRESAVDFTMPFMNLGISILYKKPTKEPPSLFSFMSPFSKEVWGYLGMAYLGVSLCLFILGRISPGEWDNPFPCIEEPRVLVNQLHFGNCLWGTIGVLLQQGSDVAPKAPSARAVASIWSFFTLIMVSSYTANLAAFLTVESVHSPINNAEDLANMKGAIRYGAKRSGTTLTFFRDAEYPIYQEMYKYMSDHPEMLTASNPEGLARVKSENYAFLMESTSIEYITERECNVAKIGGLLDDKGYGIAMRKNSAYRSALSEAVLQLQETGRLSALKTKWWEEKRGGGACGTDKSNDGAERLDMANVGGVFAVLVCGGAFGIFFGCCEWLYVIRKRANRKKVSLKTEFLSEFKFVAACQSNVRILRDRSDEIDSQHSAMSEASTKSRISPS
ncbi:uncharacterized protein LOC132262512 [Phlebotomus argentipes]|uniref:uncharacterized protein LOC132262512 n=1 Tax=Phlebotomus argentipes TaxID=94469 RepID=UPI00289381B1|nr:uncharacterized protein LOC132262512 [Phlebotomus argentipes]